MKSCLLLVALFMASAMPCLSQTQKIYGTADVKALQELPAKWEHYWNCHCLDSMKTMLRNDVDFLSVTGTSLRGKEATIKDLKQKHQSVFSESLWKNDSVTIQYLKPNVAVIWGDWHLTGEKDNSIIRLVRHGIFAWMLIKKSNQWKLIALHFLSTGQSNVPIA